MGSDDRSGNVFAARLLAKIEKVEAEFENLTFKIRLMQRQKARIWFNNLVKGKSSGIASRHFGATS
jgi:hypothetical protein